MIYRNILLDINEPVAIVTINRPDKLNANEAFRIGLVKHVYPQSDLLEVAKRT
jgi:enoyl-CoA hydratase/carnithine racemase